MPEAARRVFAHRLPWAEAFHGRLAGDGVERGLIGPREVPRLWERHLLNCAVVSDGIDGDASVCDVGSGAGLPGLVLAIRRPDLTVTLLEPLLRRTTFLSEVVEDLGLDNVEVLRGRAEEFAGERSYDVVTSRAVAPLEKLAGWCIPLVAEGGRVLAMKGSSAADEVASARAAIHRAGGRSVAVVQFGADLLDAVTTVVWIEVPNRR